MQSGPFEERLAIRELGEAFASALNEREIEAWLPLFTPDACVTADPAFDLPDIQGASALKDRWADVLVKMAGFVMISTPGMISIDKNRARVIAWHSIVDDHDDHDDHVIRTQIRSDDICVKVEDRWLFGSRHFHAIRRVLTPTSSAEERPSFGHAIGIAGLAAHRNS